MNEEMERRDGSNCVKSAGKSIHGRELRDQGIRNKRQVFEEQKVG